MQPCCMHLTENMRCKVQRANVHIQNVFHSILLTSIDVQVFQLDTVCQHVSFQCGMNLQSEKGHFKV